MSNTLGNTAINAQNSLYYFLSFTN